MKVIAPSIVTPAIISLMMVLPFLVLQLVNRSGDFPSFLFFLLWLLPFLFSILLLPILRNFGRKQEFTLSTPGLLFRIVLLVAIAWFWIAIVIDQLPCFLGVPNCD